MRKEELKNILEEMGYEVEDATITKNGGKREGISLLRKSGEEIKISPVFYPEDYSSREELEVAVYVAFARIPKIKKDFEDFEDYEKIKEKLFLRTYSDRADLSEMISKKIIDLQIAVSIGLGDGRVVSVKKAMLDQYGVTEDQVFEQALLNMKQEHPEILMFNERPTSERDLLIPASKQTLANALFLPMLIVRGKHESFAYILLHEVQEKIADLIGDFFVIPSSVHEALVIPRFTGVVRSDVLDVVSSINLNKDIISDNDYLADNVYVIRDGALVPFEE